MTEDVLAEYRLRRGQRVPIEGQVYCVEHTVVHEDSTDPYGYGAPDCKVEDHRAISWTARTGDMR